MNKLFGKTFPFIKITLFSILIINFDTAFAQSLDDGLLLNYKFNGNANDASVNGLNGIVNATLAEDRNGDPNSCYYFDGLSDYIDLPNSPILKPQLPVSISFWVNFSSLSPGVLTTDFAQNIHTGVWVSLSSEGKIAFNFGDAGSTNPSSRRTKIGETVLETGKWYHILGVVRGATDIDIFIDGINDCGIYTGTGGAITYSNSPGSIGRKDANPSLPPYYFHGFIDDFYYWSREVSIEEIFNVESVKSATNFTFFEVPGQIEPANIDTLNHTIEATINCRSAFSFAPDFTLSNNAKAYINSIEQVSGVTINNFINEVIYTVKNDMNCSSFSTDWTVIVNKTEVNEQESYNLTSFDIIEVENQVGPPKIDSLNNTIDFDVDCGANLNHLLLKYKIDENSVFFIDQNEYQSGDYFDFSNTIEASLSNEDFCVQKKWTLIVHQQYYKLDSILHEKSFFIPNIITPNQDGKNDFFQLGNLLIGSSVTIINRHGINIFHSDNYLNNFCGCDLSSGTYFYYIQNNCLSDNIKGPLTILK